MTTTVNSIDLPYGGYQERPIPQMPLAATHIIVDHDCQGHLLFELLCPTD